MEWSRSARRASAATWVFTIARNLHIDAFRRAPRPDGVHPVSPVGEAISPYQAMESDEAAARVRSALAQLPQEQAAVVHAAFYADQAQSEITQALNIPLGTVKSRLRLAIGRLRDTLEHLR